MTTLVSLVSDQSIPNVLFIKELQNNIDRYIFISTKKMEDSCKSKWVIKGSGIENKNITTTSVIEDSLDDINEKLNKIGFDEDEKIIVNLTGGTKIMSIGVYNFFISMPNAEIYYLTAQKNIYKALKNDEKSQAKQINFKISLYDYLTSYGIEISDKCKMNCLLKDYEYTHNIPYFYKNNTYKFCNFSEKLREFRNKKQLKIKEIEGLREFLTNIKFNLKDINDEYIYKEEIEYLTGGWFEELSYLIIKDKLNLNDNAIGINIKIKRGKESNELDVMYINNNTLSVVECKSAITRLTGRTVSEFFNEIIYKLTAVRRDFGLIVNSYLFTYSDFDNIESQIDFNNRAKTFNIELIDKKYFDNTELLNTKLK